MLFAKKPLASFFEIDTPEKRYFEQQLKRTPLRANYYATPLTAQSAKKVAQTEILGCFIDSDCSAKTLALLPKLQLIVTMSTGYNHIDLEYCKVHNIKVANVPTYGENTVAEHAFALILALAKNIPESINRTKANNFSLTGLQGFDLSGKTLGIVGMGNIGTHMAQMARGFSMHVLAYDPNQNMKLAKKLGFTYVSLDKLLQTSDIISLHAPLNKYTQHLLNRKNMMRIKKGAYIINTSRGELIETAALVTALKRKHIAGAGLDVLEEECAIREEKELLSPSFAKTCDLMTVIQSHHLINDPRVIVTPHNAFNSREANERILQTTVENIEGFLKGKIKNLVK